MDVNETIHRNKLQVIFNESFALKDEQRAGQLFKFVTGKEDFSPAEFYDNFGHNLPYVVMVTQGFYGEIIEDTFDKQQVIRLNTISRQKRVAARIDAGRHTKLLSIPQDYKEDLCVVNTKGEPQAACLLRNIVALQTLPITVQFPRNKTITVGNQSVSTDHIPSLELLETFDEVYMLGNFINYGIMSSEVVHVPLYLSQLRLAIVTGINFQPSEVWNSYQEEVDRACSLIHYDTEFGNKDIALYDPAAIHSDTLYSYIEPTQYANIVSIMKRKCTPVEWNPTYDEISKSGHNAKGSDYERIQSVRSKSDNHVYQTLNVKQRKQLPPTPKTDDTKVKSEAPPKRPPPASKPSAIAPTRLNAGEKVQSTPPAVPYRYKKPIPIPTDKAIDIDATQNRNGKTRQPVANSIDDVTVTENSAHVVLENRLKSAGLFANVAREDNNYVSVAGVSDRNDITKLTILQVSEYLRQLNLNKYIDSFKSNMIDGHLLLAMDMGILVNDFGMKESEALSLLKLTCNFSLQSGSRF